MPNELTIPAVKPIATPGEIPGSGKADVPHPPTAPPAPPLAHTNPSLRLDPALGLVVIEFRDDAGLVTHSIPSQRQIDAYRMHEQTPPNPAAPPGEGS